MKIAERLPDAPKELLFLMDHEEKFTDDYRKMHPLSRSPAYVEEGGPVFESAALVLHLADRHPEAGLIATPGSHERALQYQWAFFAMTELDSPLVDAARQMWKDSGEPDAGHLGKRSDELAGDGAGTDRGETYHRPTMPCPRRLRTVGVLPAR